MFIDLLFNIVIPKGFLAEKIEFLPVVYPKPTSCFNANDLFEYTNHRSNIPNCFTSLNKLVQKKTYDVEKFSINKITAIANSKSSGKYFESVVKFGKWVSMREKWSLEDCYKDLERNAIREDMPIYIKIYCWNGVHKWDNHDGSHHMAVALYLLTTNPSLPCKTYPAHITEYFINRDEANLLFSQYRFFVLAKKSWWQIYDQIKVTDYMPSNITINDGQIMIAIETNHQAKIAQQILNALNLLGDGLCIDVNRYFIEKL